jgi:uncharacterized protein (TIGR02145 family)
MKRLIILSVILSVLTTVECKAQQGSFKDYRDGNSYKWVKIGNQTWMAENLNFKVSSGTWTNTYAKLAYDLTDYGYFYNWETAVNICPSGWHLPSADEWNLLISYVGGETIAGKKLKANRKWDENGEGTDNYGFSALPGGTKGPVNWVYSKGYWWTSTIESNGNVWFVKMLDSDNGAWLRNGDNSSYYNVRCVKN